MELHYGKLGIMAVLYIVNENQTFLKTTHDGTVKDNLLHHIYYYWIKN
jgi:hypothetical protein